MKYNVLIEDELAEYLKKIRDEFERVKIEKGKENKFLSFIKSSNSIYFLLGFIAGLGLIAGIIIVKILL